MPFELKSSSFNTFVRAAWSCFSNATTGWILFFSSWITDLMQVFFEAVVFFYMATYVAPGASAYLPVKGTYAGYVVLGFLGMSLLRMVVRCFYDAVATGYWGAYWEFYGAFPWGIPAYITGATSFNFVVALLRFAVLVLVGIAVFGTNIAFGNIGAVVVVLGIGLLPTIGLGLAAASTFFLFDSKGWNDPISWATNLLASFLAGVYFPPEILQQWLQAVGKVLPHFYVLRSLRLVTMTGASLENPMVFHDLVVLTGMAVVLVPVGFLFFSLGLKRASRRGDFTRWV